MALDLQPGSLAPAEASLVTWQFRGAGEVDPYVAQLWGAIAAAHAHAQQGEPAAVAFLERLRTGFPEEVACLERFRGADGESYWHDLLKRSGLADRRLRQVPVAVERRRSRRDPGAEPA